MKTLTLILLFGAAAAVHSAEPASTNSAPKQAPPPVSVGAAPARSPQSFVYDQKPIGGRPVLISPEQATSVIERFKTNFVKGKAPRIVLYVNRDLVDENSGLKLTSRTEKTQKNTTKVDSEFKRDPNTPANVDGANHVPPGGNVTIVGNVSGNANRIPGKGNVSTSTEKVANETTYKANDSKQQTLADKQTVRDVERLFGRPLRMGGAHLADQKVATQLLADGGIKELQTESEQARKDRAALAKVADIAVEILISSRNVVAQEISGDKTYQIPDIQATAIRLKDAKIVGQATSSDIIGKDRFAGNIARNFDVREISEATALALMEDMLMSAE